MVAIVTDIHYRMSLAVVRELGEAGVTVICCESERHCADAPLGALSRYCAQQHRLPAENECDALLALCREVGAQYHCRPALLPLGAATLALVAANRAAFDGVCGLLCPTRKQLDLFNSKERLGTLAASLGVPVPEGFCRRAGESVEDLAARLPYPCVIKPVCGEKLGLTAAKRYQFVNTADEAAVAFSHYRTLSGEDPVVQRRLTGGALGCSVLAQDGRVLHSICHRRLREYPIGGGPSSCCRCEVRDDLLRYAEKLVAATDFSGLAMFEFKEDAAGAPHLLEVNPRVWGTYPLTRVSRSGFSLLWCTLAWNAANDPVPLPPATQPKRCKMIFAASDAIAAFGYLRHGKLGKAFSALLDLLNPAVRDGVFEWRDRAPAFAYARSLLKKGRHS